MSTCIEQGDISLESQIVKFVTVTNVDGVIGKTFITHHIEKHYFTGLQTKDLGVIAAFQLEKNNGFIESYYYRSDDKDEN